MFNSKYKEMINTINNRKVDIRTSDIFFNYGAPNYTEASRSKTLTDKEKLRWLYVDADKFLYIIDTPNITRQDLVDDYLHRV